MDLPSCPAGPHTHSLAETCLLIGCESEDWLVERVRSGEFPARRVVRKLRFSDSDILQIIDACAEKPRVAKVEQLVPTSRRRAS